MTLDFDFIVLICFLLFLFGIAINLFWIIKHKNISIIKRLILSLLIAAVCISLPIIYYVSLVPSIMQSTPKTEGIWASYSEPVKVIFNIPVDINRLTVNITPQIKGNWVWKPYLGINRLTREGLFYPEETLFQGQRIVVYITGIGRVGFRDEGHEAGFVFDSVKLPEIILTNPANLTADISSNQEIILTYDKPTKDLVDISYKFDPAIDFEVTQINDTQFKIAPDPGWKLSTHYTLNVERTDKRINLTTKEELERDNPVLIHQFQFDTQKTPLISHFSPEGKDIRINSPIKILFASDMQRDSVEKNLFIEPEIVGTFQWLSDKALVFTAETELPKATEFKVRLNKGTMSKDGLETDSEITFNFETLGKVNVNAFTPFNNEVKVNEGVQIKVNFNQDVDKESAQKSFLLDPVVEGDFSWEANTLIFVPRSALAYNTTYTIIVLPGVKSVYGMDSQEQFASKFTTRRNEVVISMPLYYQPQYPVSFSCNIYASMMALAWKGFSTSASGLIGEIGYDPSQDAQGRWLADPNQVYVGNSDGSWGYGVYWNATQKVFTNRGIKTEIHGDWNLSGLAKSIEAGHPVQIWRYNGTSRDTNIDWGTSDVYAINGQHGGVVTGFRGTSDNPYAFYINDPWFGLIWMDSGSFDYYWSRLNRVGLVIF